ncbi:MAG: FmdB family zinc ribbon protein [Desulfobulbus sp.]|nr:zinc ribbon domain-containing protein [Desulfobulbaceae bacterium]
MPLYEYHCRSCDKDFEQLTTSAASQQIVACPHCGSTEVRKQISASSHRSSPAQTGPTCQPRGGFR